MCGIVGVMGSPEAAKDAYLGLYQLQHRGQESAGASSTDGTNLHLLRGMGYASTVLKDRLAELPGFAAIGHVRYPTEGESTLKNAQPIFLECKHGPISLVHNGNLTNAERLKQELTLEGSGFQTSSDSEVILHLYARSVSLDPLDAIMEALRQVEGAYALVILTKTHLVAARDPQGFRPLALGRRTDGAYVVCSETCALDILEAEYLRDVEPGEMVVLSESGGFESRPIGPPMPTAQCVFEHVYFARPDSYVFGQSVHSVRKEMGRNLAKEVRIDADVVVPVPDSGIVAAEGYAKESGIPLEHGLIRNHHVGRTFIKPDHEIRTDGVRMKLNPVRAVINQRRVVLVDDSLVRGTTSRKIVQLVRNAGASEVHLVIASPPTMWPCFMGIATKRRSQLKAATHSLEEIRAFLEVDTLSYLSHAGMMEAVGTSRNLYCSACFNGQYPISLPPELAKHLTLVE